MTPAAIGLSTRLALAMTALVVVTAGAIGLFTYRNVESAALPRALERIDQQAELLSTRLAAAVAGARADVIAFRYAAALDGIMQTGEGEAPTFQERTRQEWKRRLAMRITAELAVKPLYSQFRIIGVANGGREILRVDRSGPRGEIRVVPDDELQAKGERAYLQKALALPEGRVYVSPVELNQEHGHIEVPHVPVLRVATPIHQPDGNPFGVIVVNVDLRRPFSDLRSGVAPPGQVYVVNAGGDFLVHPNHLREFGFDLGHRARLQDSFPGLAASLTSDDPKPRLVTSADGERLGVGLAVVHLAGGPRLTIINSMPYDTLFASTAVVQNSSLVIGLIATLVAAVLAMWVARTMTRPLGQMTTAVEQFGRGGTFEAPTGASGEIGVLARAFDRMARDVRRTQAEVRRHAELIDKTIAVMADGVLVVDGRGRRLFVNPAGHAMIGEWTVFGSREWEQTYEHLWPEGTAPLPKEDTPVGRALRGENFDNMQLTRLRAEDGRPIQVIVTGRVIRDDTGQVEFAVIVYHDVTELAEKTVALTKEIEERRRVFETSLDLILVVDPHGKILRVSPSAHAILGYEPEDMIGRNGLDFIVADDLEKTRSEMREARRGNVMRNFQCRYFHKDGHVVDLNWNGVWSGPEQKHFFIGRDMTESIRLEQQLRQSQKMDAIGQLVGGVAHDFNNILTVITGTIEILAKGVADKPQLATVARMIDQAAVRGADLTRQLLAFARRQPLEPRRTDINALVVDAARLLRPTLGEQVEIDSMLASEPWPAIVDPSQLSTALINLAVNARDAMPNGGRLLLETSNVTLDEDYARANPEVAAGDYVMITVSDTGRGIPAAIRDKVFEPFFTTKEVGKGTGLGLSMVYGFVRQSGGHLKIYSEEGHGTTIKLYLPRADEHDVARSDVSVAGEPPRGDETILMVEDDEMVRSYVGTLLKSLGYRTLEAGSAAEALAMIDQGARFDLLFTDIIMPGGMNGRELAAAARARDPGIKVLYTSGYAENALMHNGRIEADVALLSKPYRKLDLALQLRAVLSDRREAAHDM